MNHKFIKTLAVVVLFFFSWTFGGVFQVAYAIDNLPGTGLRKGFKRQSRKSERFLKTMLLTGRQKPAG
jgi:hypothetical protein